MSAPPPVAEPAGLVFLYDVDNTLLNNDQLKSDVDARLDRVLGVAWSDLFWRIYEEVRQQEDVVDIPEAIRQFEDQCSAPDVCREVHEVFDGVDFRHYLYPGALAALEHTGRLGTNVILSDGDPVFQKAKIEHSGIAAAAGGHVLIYVHKEDHSAEIRQRFPATRYVMIDDKPRILKELPKRLDDGLLTVFVLQGKYAADPAARADLHPSLVLAGIADLCAYSAAEFRSGQFHAQAALP